MSPSKGIAVVAGFVALAAVLAAVAFALPFERSGSHPTTAIGPGMMNGSNGMMGGYGSAQAATPPSAGSLASVRTQVERWLRSRGFGGFRVGEVMAFTNNDYVAVKDASGKPAFELLTTPTLSWLMEEPPSMMWNRRYGKMRGFGGKWSGMASMMGGSYGHGRNGWYDGGHGSVDSLTAAIRLADRWLGHARSGERVDPDVGAMGHFPGYYTLDTTRHGKTVGMLSVNAANGAVWYHGWHGRFLGEREF